MSFLGGHLEYTPFSGIHNSLPEYSVVGKKIGTFCIIIKNMHADILSISFIQKSEYEHKLTSLVQTFQSTCQQ